ncbi:MAG: hypothetical protein AVDCRST_MAG48-3000, partial [uncultured Friedmanniella sp.]
DQARRGVRDREGPAGPPPVPGCRPPAAHRPGRVRRLGAHPAAPLPRRHPRHLDPPQDHPGARLRL